VKEVAMEVEEDQTERINIQEVDQIQMKNASFMAAISGASATRILEATIIISARGSRGDGQGRNNRPWKLSGRGGGRGYGRK
jgi:hypothetical protein